MAGPDIRSRANAVSTCISSGSVAVGDSPKVVKALAGILRSILVYTNGTQDATIIAYDNASAGSGTVLAQVKVVATDLMGGIVGMDVEFKNGCTITLSGTGCSAIVHYV